MTAEPPNVAILEDIADRLPDKGRAWKLRGLSKQVVNSHSCLADLRYAKQILELLDRSWIAQGIEEHHKLQIQHSLTCNAVVLYCRATVGGRKGGGRGSSDIASKLSSEAKENHDQIIEFRNKIIAHVHVGHALNGYAWNPSHAVVIREPDGWTIGAVSRPLSLQEPISNALKTNVPAAIDIVQARHERYIDLVWPLLQSLDDDGPIYECMQDSAKLLGSKDAAWAVLRGRVDGSTFGIGRED